MYKIPVWRTVGGAFGFAITHYRQFLNIAALPLALLTPLYYLIFTSGHLDKETAANASSWMIIVTVLIILISTALPIQIVRYVISAENFSYRDYFDIKFIALFLKSAWLFVKYIAAMAILFLLAAIPCLLLALALDIGGVPRPIMTASAFLLFFIISAPLFLRAFAAFYLLWIGIISGVTHNISWAWRLPKGNSLRIFSVIFLLVLPGAILMQAGTFTLILSGLFALTSGAGPVLFTMLSVLNVILNIPMMIGITFVCMALRDYSGQEDATGTAAAPAT